MPTHVRRDRPELGLPERSVRKKLPGSPGGNCRATECCSSLDGRPEAGPDREQPASGPPSERKERWLIYRSERSLSSDPVNYDARSGYLAYGRLDLADEQLIATGDGTVSWML